jgi:hypothetical protein
MSVVAQTPQTGASRMAQAAKRGQVRGTDVEGLPPGAVQTKEEEDHPLSDKSLSARYVGSASTLSTSISEHCESTRCSVVKSRRSADISQRIPHDTYLVPLIPRTKSVVASTANGSRGLWTRGVSARWADGRTGRCEMYHKGVRQGHIGTQGVAGDYATAAFRRARESDWVSLGLETAGHAGTGALRVRGKLRSGSWWRIFSGV